MVKHKRNFDKHTDAELAKARITVMLDGLYRAAAKGRYPSLVGKAALGYCAFPSYSFRAPQGAAFSVAKIVRELERDGLVRYVSDEPYRGYMAGPKLIEAIGRVNERK